jgi:hypothetical protein
MQSILKPNFTFLEIGARCQDAAKIFASIDRGHSSLSNHVITSKIDAYRILARTPSITVEPQ